MTLISCIKEKSLFFFVWESTCLRSLFPKLSENTIGKTGWKLAKAWFFDLSCTQKFSNLWNLVDISTDALFVNSIRDKHLELSYMASVSLLFSIGSFVTMLFLDASFFAASANSSKESENNTIRRILRMRWGILVFVPLEGSLFFHLETQKKNNLFFWQP